MMNKLPKIRENLLVQDLADEVLIYDQATNKSYCLNETAKTVFNACDGKKMSADINLPEDIIYLSLDELKKQNLIENNYVSPFNGMNRREVIKKVGLTSMIMLPVIASLAAPSAAAAASVCPDPLRATTTQASVAACSEFCESRCRPCASNGFGYGNNQCTCSAGCTRI